MIIRWSIPQATASAVAIASTPSRARRQPWLDLPWKRGFDLAIASVLLVLLSPVLIAIWLAVRCTSPGPGLFWSSRIGRFGRVFSMPKFRTMRVHAPIAPRESLRNSGAYITPLGHGLRRLSLDELPQLWSVIVGDMSLIGPRPLIPSDPGARARGDFPHLLALRPGMSGLAQVSGRNLVSPRRKARYDAFYAARACLFFDALLIGKTLRVLASRGGGGVL